VRHRTDNGSDWLVGKISCAASSTTVVDRRSAVASLVSDSDSTGRGIDDAFAIGTSGEDAQRRAIRAREGE
jgi:hypothetical protein